MLRFHIFNSVSVDHQRNIREETDEFLNIGAGTTIGTTVGLILLPIEPITGGLLLAMGWLIDEINGGAITGEVQTTRTHLSAQRSFTRAYPEPRHHAPSTRFSVRPIAPKGFGIEREPMPFSIQGGEKYSIWPAGKVPESQVAKEKPNSANSEILMIGLDKPLALTYDPAPKQNIFKRMFK